MVDHFVIEKALKERVFEYALIPAGKIVFSPELLKACEQNVCGKYNKCWTCPPAVNHETLKKQIMNFSGAFVFSTKYDLEDSFDYEGMKHGQDAHSKLSREMHEMFGKINPVFGAGGCSICKTCAFPNACLFPDKTFPSIEAAGINVTELSSAGGMRYNNGENTVTYFSIILTSID
jgi:predicted metal-binding protein